MQSKVPPPQGLQSKVAPAVKVGSALATLLRRAALGTQVLTVAMGTGDSGTSYRGCLHRRHPVWDNV